MNPPFVKSRKTLSGRIRTGVSVRQFSFAHSGGFSLVELLAVIFVILTLSVLSGPALQSLRNAGSVNKSVVDLSRTLEYARAYAMANRTYVRVLLSEPVTVRGGIVTATVAMAIYSSDGSSAAGSATDMANTSKWPSLGRPLVLEDLEMNDSLQTASPVDTSRDITPTGKNLSGDFAGPVTRPVPGLNTITFKGVIQFGPAGEARVGFDEAARYIKIAMVSPQPDVSSGGSSKNPFILRLSGANGSVAIFRAGELDH